MGKLTLGLSLVIASASIAPAMAGARQVGKIWLQSGMPQEQIKLILKDREVFQTFTIGKSDEATLMRLLGTPSASPAALTAWLEERVQIVVDESFDTNKNLVVLALNPTYENPGILPLIEKSTVTQSGTSVIVMSNIGVGIYRHAKATKRYLGVNIPGIGTIGVKSPRSGIIKVGPGLFTLRRVDEKNLNAAANSVPRLATFFHEARHSDGNGNSLGFFHAVCPAGHGMAGHHSCDRNLNGPYTVAGWTIKAMTESCAQCSVGQREKLRLRYLDNFSRVLTKQLNGSPAVHLNAASEGKL